jgi:hypothetical protein
MHVVSGISIVMAVAIGASGLQEPPATGGGEAQKATPPPVSAAGAPDSEATHLNADVGKAIAEIVARMLAMPRREEHVEVADEARSGRSLAADPRCWAGSSGRRGG